MSDSVWPHRQKPTRLPHPWDSPGKNNSPMHESEKWKWSRSVVFGFPRGDIGKESISQCRRHKRCRSDPWVWKIPWRRKWQSTPVFLPGESHGQRSLASYSPWGCKGLDMTEHVSLPLFKHTSWDLTFSSKRLILVFSRLYSPVPDQF